MVMVAFHVWMEYHHTGHPAPCQARTLIDGLSSQVCSSQMMHLRLQGTDCVAGRGPAPTTPVLAPHIEFEKDLADITLAVYVKI